MRTSKGLGFAVTMLALGLLEVLVLAEILFVDRAGFTRDRPGTFLHYYFAAASLALLLQGMGVAFVLRGRYRQGGILQIVSSSFHAIKLEGVIGIWGGILACRHAEAQRRQASSGTSEPSPTASAASVDSP